MTPTSHKMDTVITALVHIMFMAGCMGSVPGGTDLTPEYKRKVFDMFKKTYSYEGDHAKRMTYQWNRENPSHEVSDHRKLYEHAWSVIEDKCKEFERRTGVNFHQYIEILSDIHKKIIDGRPEITELVHEKLRHLHPLFHHVSEDLTWSLVYDWHRYYAEHIVPYDLDQWTDVMKASLLYIREQVRREGKETRSEIKRRWMLLYPNFNVRSTTLGFNLRVLDESKYQPTRDVRKEAKDRYDSLFATETEKANRRRWKWTDQMLTDLMYIATHLDPHSKFFTQKIKRQWDQMNHIYQYMSEKSLLKRLYKLRAKQDFKLRPIYIRNAKEKYERLTPIDEKTLVSAPMRHLDKLIEFLEEYKEAFDKFMKNMDSHDVSGHYAGSLPSSSQHFHSEHSSRELTRDLSAPIHSPVSVPEFGYPPHYGMQHYLNMSRYDVGASSSNPWPSHSGHSPGGGTSSLQEYHQPEFTRDLSAPIHSPPLSPGFGYRSDYGMHFHPNVSGYDVGGSSSTPRPFHSGHSPEGGTSAPHQYQHPEFQQNLSAPIHSPTSFPEFGYFPDYGMHSYPNISVYDVGGSSSTPRPTHSVHFPGGETSAPYEPHFSQDPSTPIHPPQAPAEIGSPSRFVTQTSSSDPTFDPQFHTTRPRHGKGSSQPKARKRRP